MKRILFLVNIFLIFTIVVGCTETPTNVDNDAPAVTESVEQVEALALELAEAVMVYDLKTLQTYTALSMQAQESILDDVLPYGDDGKIDWDGVICDTYSDFVDAYDAERNIPYKTLEFTVTASRIMSVEDAADILNAADETEKKFRSEEKMAVYAAESAKLAFNKVAVITVAVHFQNTDRADGNGVLVESAPADVTLQIVLIKTDGIWKSYSPTLCGTFPPLGHLQRYVTSAE